LNRERSLSGTDTNPQVLGNSFITIDIEPAVVISDQIPIYLLPNLRGIADIPVSVASGHILSLVRE